MIRPLALATSAGMTSRTWTLACLAMLQLLSWPAVAQYSRDDCPNPMPPESIPPSKTAVWCSNCCYEDMRQVVEEWKREFDREVERARRGEGE